MSVLTRKKELINWISSIEDVSVLREIEKIKQQEAFDFDKEFQRSINASEFKEKTTKFIKALPWKKV